jgi:putative membrane protein
VLLAYLNEAFMLLSALSVALGWRAIRRGRREVHRRYMLTASTLAVAFFLSYMLKSLLVGDTNFGGPKAWAVPYLVFLQVHTILATLTAVLGIVTLRYALRSRFGQHRRVAPWTATSWFVAAGMGLAVFLMLYIVFPPGATTNMLRAIIGH